MVRSLSLSRKWSLQCFAVYSTIIPRVRVEYELVIIISYPTSTSGIIVLLKTPKKPTDSQPVVNFEQTRTVIIFGERDIVAHIT